MRTLMVMRAARCGLLLLGLALSACAAPVVRTLPNGMTVIVDEMHSAPVAAVRLYINAGSVYEQEFTGAGITHYLEHLIGKGSETRTAEEIDDLQEAMGNQTNAYTSTSHTCYHMVSSARYVDQMIDLVADYVFHPLLDEKDVETQRGIILREMAMGDDDPGRRIHYLLNETMFRVHPERYRVIGYPAHFTKITRRDLLTYHKRMYTPDNALMVVVGDFRAEDVLATLTHCLEGVPRTGTPLPALPPEPAQVGPRRAEEVVPDLARAYLAMGWRTVSLDHPDLYPLDVLAYVLSNGASSRLVSRLRDDEGLVDSIGCYSVTPVYDAGRFVVAATLDEGKLAEAEAAILAEIERLTAEAVTERELERARNQKTAELVYAQADVEQWADTLGSDYLSTGDVDFSRRYVEGIRRVTAQDMLAAAQRYLRPGNMTVAVRRAGKAGGAEAGPTSASAAPTTVRTVLPNGIILLAQEDRRAPLVSVQAAFLGGLRYETDKDAGIGDVMAAMLRRGTTTRSRLDIAQALEDVGASLGATSGRNSFIVNGLAQIQHAPILFPLLADCIRNPAFAEEELARVRELQLAALRGREDDPSQITTRLMLEALFTRHPYRLDPLGTEESLRGITHESLQAYHARICRPEGMVLSIYGDLTAAQAEELARQHFGDWPGEAARSPRLPRERPPAREVRVLRERKQEQAMLYMGFPGLTVDSRDMAAMAVLDAAMSGIHYPGGRLHDRLRGAQLVYATHMVPVAGLDPGFIMVYAATAPDKLEQVEGIIREIITALQTTELPPEEFERARSMCIAAHEVQLGELSSRIMQEGLDELYGMGYDHTLGYAQRVDKVTAADVRKAAREYLDLDHCVVAITRPPATEGSQGQAGQ